MFATRDDAKKAGWFSRRHKDSAAHTAHRDAWDLKKHVKKDRAEEQRQKTAEHSEKAFQAGKLP